MINTVTVTVTAITAIAAITAINTHAGQRLLHIGGLLNTLQKILVDHPTHDLIALLRTEVDVLANDIDLMSEAAEQNFVEPVIPRGE
jgi:hypothetical protein